MKVAQKLQTVEFFMCKDVIMILEFYAMRKPVRQVWVMTKNEDILYMQDGLYVSFESDILLKANFTKSSQVSMIGT